PRGEQIGRPLETEAARRERRKHRETRDTGNGRVRRMVGLAWGLGPAIEHRQQICRIDPAQATLPDPAYPATGKNRMGTVQPRCCDAASVCE
ncbi:MAG TPA: hypothetical protein VJT13_10375, partial [Xanthobacteraceae bacterium]|nr:hypothetical protein [Xanthobacteraceae bacterium]